MTARSGRDPGAAYAELTARFGAPAYRRIDAPATPDQKAVLARLSPEAVTATELAGDPVTGILTAAPGNGAAIGGLKVSTTQGWFAARPSGTENVYKVYAESFRGDGAPGSPDRGGPGAGWRRAGRGMTPTAVDPSLAAPPAPSAPPAPAPRSRSRAGRAFEIGLSL